MKKNPLYNVYFFDQMNGASMYLASKIDYPMEQVCLVSGQQLLTWICPHSKSRCMNNFFFFFVLLNASIAWGCAFNSSIILYWWSDWSLQDVARFSRYTIGRLFNMVNFYQAYFMHIIFLISKKSRKHSCCIYMYLWVLNILSKFACILDLKCQHVTVI